MNNNIVVAIDGYSSCGKSTLAKALAKELHFIYVDSGAMYRAVTLYFLRHNIDLENHAQIADALHNIHLNFHTQNYKTFITLNEEDVSEEIRQMHVADKVSSVAAIKEVRAAMVRQQQRLGRSKNIIMDGRDIGTVVFPDAQVKLFMTADPKIRAERRYKELLPTNPNITLEEVFDNLAHRDYQDTTREESPLTRAEDAIILDNTDLSQDEQLMFAISHIEPFIAE
ncbi:MULTISPECIES: (d)CMP kinase [Mucilaginibacter]|jgi:cytidylate kinase|uniref:Cytidylate kinase n=1 Tax=Mucilaginibacter rubeus TaxID=2027860 RepID=A0AAE6JGQ2_9SPHI|nr:MULTISPECIES: (d)CMP kinase [Mucilaginibacter]QEM05369.1 (d)CMP kinase [Mucilaginibacter rubeus]QEM17958.1 (d)CMP kinase [Mucilaginibacter gossypii]QTE45508.1 (d)CMP kinase [Mucilaginibacter rubeus]QTE52105.1 (d)CMP kinase [Mucilaginibacter rubeus]QTE57193.1 (d)CMP kinase [Mucilaginibacter rubeus]